MKKYLVFAMCCGLLMACDNKAGSETTDEEQPVQPPVVLNETNFPDENFRAIVCYLFDAEEGDTIQADRFSEVEDLDLHDYWLIDLKGIECFTALEQLDCSDNLLKEIDVSKNAELKSLDCGYNRLTAIQPFYRHINIKRPAGKPNLGKESSHMWSTKLSHSYWHTPGNMRILSMRDNIELTPRD